MLGLEKKHGRKKNVSQENPVDFPSDLHRFLQQKGGREATWMKETITDKVPVIV